MKIASLLGLLVLSFVAEPALAQRADLKNSLGRARATYDASDADKDGKVTLDELTRQKLKIPKVDFDAMDADKDGSWSRDEFVVYYRRLLLNSGERAADDLEAEVARIQALRRAKLADSAPKRPTVPPTPTPTADIGERLRLAIDELEKKAALRQATRDDFQRVKDGLVERARQLAAQDPANGTGLVAKFEAAVDALETKAREGNYSRDDYTALRESLIARGRDAAKPIPATGPVNAPLTEEQLQAALDAALGSGSAPATPATPVVTAPNASNDLALKLELALDDLAQKAESRQATREDFGRVRDAMTARARAIASSDPAAAGRLVTLDELFAKAMEKLESDAREGKFSRQEFQNLRDNYVNRARAIAGSGVPAAQPVTPPPPITPAVTDGIEKRFDDAVMELERKALARGATRADFQRVNDLLVARARAAVQTADGAPVADTDPRIAALAASLQGAMARLESAAGSGGLSAADFSNLRQMLIARARDAVKTPAPEVKPPDPKPTDPPKPVDAPPVRTRPVPERPKPVDPPKDDGTSRPAIPPHQS